MVFLEILLYVYLSFCVIYIFYYSIRGKLYQYKDYPESSIKNKIAVFIPAYRENEVIFDVAQKALEQNYPPEKYDVVVIADGIILEVIEKLSSLPVKVFEVSFARSTKVKALQKAVLDVDDNYQLAVILDADNVMETDFLSKMNDVYNASHKSIQGRRVAKNKNTKVAVLDGLSEIINNHIFRLGYNASNLSSSIIGSGMAFDFSLFKDIILKMDSVGGFDRELQLLLLKQGIKTKYIPTAIVYDEKIQNTKALQNQRRRWISSQFFYLKKYFFEGIKALLKGDYNFFDSAVLSNLLLPRVILLGSLFFLSIFSFVFKSALLVQPLLWILLLLLCLMALVLPIPLSYYNWTVVKSLSQLPATFFAIFKSLMTIKGANKKFIHTTHGEVKTTK